MTDEEAVSLVGPVLLAAVPGTAASSVRLATASLLVATAAARSSADWSAGLTGSLTSMGWTSSGTTTDASTPTPPAFVPWDVTQEMVRTTLAPVDVKAVEHALSLLSNASPQVAARWQTATSVAANHLRAAIAVVAQTGGDPRLGIVVVELAYPQAPPVTAAFPWGQWPSAGARLTQTTSLLVIDEAVAVSLLDALAPKVGAVLSTDVVAVSP